MIVIEQYFDVKTGEGGRREIEMPDVTSQEDAKLTRERQREQLKAQMRELLVEEALGLDVTERKRELCTAFSALR